MKRCQQDEVYAAERVVEVGHTFASQAEIQRWVDDELLNTPWWHERFPNVLNIECPTVTRRRGEGSVGCWYEETQYGKIEMAPVHWNVRCVCHEVAHVTADSKGSTAHDPLFVRHYLELVYRMMGTEVWMQLRQSLLDHGVVIDPKDDN